MAAQWVYCEACPKTPGFGTFVANSTIMRNLAITFLAVTSFAIGCKPAAEKPADVSPSATTAQFDKVKTETKEASHEMKEYTYADS